MQVEMSKRVTSIVGAGAVLDFDFEDKTFPSTANITYSGAWRHEHYPFPLVSALVKSDLSPASQQ